MVKVSSMSRTLEKVFTLQKYSKQFPDVRHSDKSDPEVEVKKFLKSFLS
jgi:hypothetical protein